MSVRFVLAALLASAGIAAAADPAWPPPPQSQSRIEALHRTIGDAAATPAERQAAREELKRLLMHPAAPKASRAERPARAAVIPSPRIAAPEAAPAPKAPAGPAVAPPGAAPLPIPDGRGGTVVPAGPNAVDPRTGALLIDVGNGYLDPATGRFVPKP